MGQVNKFPPGFLDMLGAQAQGKTPPQYGEVVAPTINLDEFYLADSLSGIRKDQSFAGEATLGFEVPDEEVWILRGGSVLSILDSAARYEMWTLGVIGLPRVSDATTVPGGAESNASLWTSPLLQVQANNETVIAAVTLPAPIMLLPGATVTWKLIQRDAAAARISQLSVLASVLRRQ